MDYGISVVLTPVRCSYQVMAPFTDYGGGVHLQPVPRVARVLDVAVGPHVFMLQGQAFAVVVRCIVPRLRQGFWSR